MLPRKRSLLLLLVCLALVIPLQAQESLSPDAIDNIARSVVKIGIIENGFEVGNGSGTIISADGLIYTNRHVVENAEDLAIYMLDDINEQPVLAYYAHEVTSFEEMDFAIVQIDRDADGDPLDKAKLNLPFLEPSDEPARRGEHIYTFGYPGIGNGYLVMSEGTITTVQNGDVGKERLPVWYQTDAEIAPGNSGGLAVNPQGKVLGIPSEVQQDFETSGRLGGILPFTAILKLPEVGTRIMVSSTNATPQVATDPISIDCDGAKITNGVELLVQNMRPDVQYTISAISPDVDPVLVIRDAAHPNDFICSDDSADASRIRVNLPDIGTVAANNKSASLQFAHGSSNETNISIVVGSKNRTPGSVIVLLEGMEFTPLDTPGDVYRMSVTQDMIDTRISLDAYMIGMERTLDPLLMLVDDRLRDIEKDASFDPIYCDDAASTDCWHNSESLDNSSVTTSDGKRYDADSKDAMFYMERSDLKPGMLNFMATSYETDTFGKYLLLFRIGL